MGGLHSYPVELKPTQKQIRQRHLLHLQIKNTHNIQRILKPIPTKKEVKWTQVCHKSKKQKSTKKNSKHKIRH